VPNVSDYSGAHQERIVRFHFMGQFLDKVNPAIEAE
jgi:hypothetical protein